MSSECPMPIQPIPLADFTPAMKAFVPPNADPKHATWSGVLGKAGPLAELLLPYYSALTTQSRLSPKLIELVRIAVATTTSCEACLNFRDPRVYGTEIGDDVLDLIKEFETTSGFTERERSAIRYALAFGTNHHSIDDAMWSQLKSVFDDEEILHLCLYVAHYMGMGRLGHAMRLIDAQCTLPGYRFATLTDAKHAQDSVDSKHQAALAVAS